MPIAVVIFREKKLEWLKISLFPLTAASHRGDSTLCHMAWVPCSKDCNLIRSFPLGDNQATVHIITCVFFFDRFIHRPKAVIICKHLQGNNQDTLEQLLPNPTRYWHSELNTHSHWTPYFQGVWGLNKHFVFLDAFICSLFLFVPFCASLTPHSPCANPVDVKDFSTSPSKPILAIPFSPEFLFCKLTDVL